MILIIMINQIPFHYYEFVKPIENILKNEEASFETIHYKKIDKKELSKYDKIIIAGTSLKDNSFLVDIRKFDFSAIMDYSNQVQDCYIFFEFWKLDMLIQQHQ